MGRAHLSLALLSTLTALGAFGDFYGNARAWTPISPSRPVWGGTVPYQMQSAGSADLGADATEAIVREGMEDWTRVSCTSLTASYGGRTASRPGSYEGRSVIGWVESGWPHDGNAIGVTGPSWSRFIVEADMTMNGVNFTWIEGAGSGSRVNTYSIVLHEGGHYYGLGHSSEPNATMYFAYSGGVDMLRADDENGICALYPMGSGVDCTTTGCPSGQECVDRMCRTIVGDGSICSPCSGDGDCGGGGNLCLGYPEGDFCGRSCSSAADCSGDVCADIGAPTPQCIRVVGRTPTCTAGPTPECTRDSDCAANERCSNQTCVARPSAGGPIGAACTDSADCASTLCFRGACSQTCEWLEPTSCPSGYYCNGNATGSCGDGVCLAGNAGTRTIGASCSADTECDSLFCSNNTCSLPCVPGVDDRCPAGYACQVGALPGCGSCKVSGSLGDPCEGNGDCTSGLCAATDSSQFCTEFCDDGAPCASGFSCLSAGDRSVCVPDGGGLGAACEDNADCLSTICATESSRTYCTRICGDSTPCPGGFACIATADGTTRVCQPEGGGGGGGGGGGCSASGTRSSSRTSMLGLGMLGLAALALRVRRRRAP